MKLIGFALALLAFVAIASAKTYFDEEFNGDWQARWVESKHKGADRGKVGLSAGDYFSDEAVDAGFQTQEDLRFYQWTAQLSEPFDNTGKDLVLQYRVKFNKHLDCGGAYLKLLPSGFDASDFNGDTKYNIMFGPDVCGSTKRTHFIINYKGENHLRRVDLPVSSDTASHIYTLIIRPDQTYDVLRDGESIGKGSITDDFDVLPPKTIKDPKQSKPADWVDEAEISDPADVKPADWDSIPAQIADPDATKPDDWDSELDGEWTAPLIDNPAYKGAWKAKKIPNPAYKGKWEHPMIPNPDYKEDNTITNYKSAAVGYEVWQVTSGVIIDDILVTDDVAHAEAERKEVMLRIEQENAVKKAKEEADRKKREEEAKAKNAAGGEDDDDEEGDDDDEAEDAEGDDDDAADEL